MADNRKYENGRYLYLTVGSGVTSGDFVMIGNALGGVAQYDADSDNKAVVDTAGVYDLSVTGEDDAGNVAVSIGDRLYYDGSNINKKASGKYVGKALETVTSGSTSTIMVKLNDSSGGLASKEVTYDKQALPRLRKLTQSVAYGDFTDNGDATGYVDLDTDLPKGAIVTGTKLVVTTAFDSGSTSTATAQVGISGDLDRFTENTDLDVNSAGTVGSTPAPEAMDGVGATATPRVTVTEDSDFGQISSGEMTVEIYYIETE